MCVIFWCSNHPKYSLILAGNRDEFYERPTQKAHIWDNGKIVGGKDLIGTGTWMAVNKKGKFAALTNVREPYDIEEEEKKSRGNVIINRLLEIPYDPLAYKGYNLIFNNDENQVCYESNRGGKRPFSKIIVSETLKSDRVWGLSNGKIGEAWPKVKHGVKLMSKILLNEPQTKDELVSALFLMLQYYKLFLT
jgi:uncharacterized protein with NRDE domain